MESKEIILKNGIRVLLVDAPGSTAATIQCWFRAGSAYEKKSEQGIAHFLEHMFFKGTSKRPGNKIADIVESFGGELNAFTSFDYTCYFINCPSSKLLTSTEILLDMISNPVFAEKDFASEIGVVMEEYKRSLDSASQFSFFKMQESFFNNGYAHPILGTDKTIPLFNKKTLTEFRNKYYSTNNLLVVIAGDLKNQKKILSKVESFTLPKGSKNKKERFSLKKKQQIEIHKKETTMCQLTLCIQGKTYSNDNAVREDLALNCLGHGETSRFHKGIVLDNTLANYASASTMYMSDGSAHFLRFSYPEENSKKVLSRIIKIIQGVQKEGFSKEEISKIQNQYSASKIYERESIEGYAFTLGSSYIQTGDYNCEDEFIKKIQAENHKSVLNGLNDLLCREIHLSLQLPMNANESKARKDLDQFNESLQKLKDYAEIKEERIKINKSKFDPQTSLVTLKDGVKLIHRQSLLTPTFTMHAYLRGGLTEETKASNGIYNVLSTVIPKGHKDATNDQLRLFFENKCASLAGFSGKNAYGMTMNGLTKDINKLTDHFFKSLLFPTMEEEIVDHEIELNKRVIHNQKEEAAKLCFDQFHNYVFGNHPYSYNVLGSEESLANITPDKLKKLHKKNINSKELLLTYCGDLDLHTVISLIEKYVDLIPSKIEKTKTSNKKILAATGKSSFIDFDREQTHIMIGIPTKKLGDPENIYLKMLTAHFAGQSSELFSILRDQMGLCYSAQPVNFQALEGSYWGIYVACGNDKVTQTIEETKKIVNKITSKGISKREFAKIKSMIKGQQELNIQTNDDYANLYSVPVLQGLGLDFFFDSTKQIASMTYENFQKEIKDILNVDANVVVVGRSASKS